MVKKYNISTFFMAPTMEMRNLLKITEKEFCSMNLRDLNFPRDYILYGIFDEIEKVAVVIRRYEGLISREKNKSEEEAGRLYRNILSSIYEEQSLWIRKLTEILAQLINFQTNNSEIYYRHYLLCKEVCSYRKQRHDLLIYYGIKRKHDLKLEDGLLNYIRETEVAGNLDLNECWYLNSKKIYQLSGFSEILERAMRLSSKVEKVALGVSYSMYRQMSRDIHVRSGNRGFELNIEKIKQMIGHLSILSSCIIVRARKIMRVSRRGQSLFLKNIINDSLEKDTYEASLKPKISVGDFVLVGDNLGEVKRVILSKFGYKSLYVSFYQENNWNQRGDYFVGRHVKMFVGKKKRYKEVCETLEAEGRRNLSAKKINEILRQSIVISWKKMLKK
jgi:hypothetical protein